MPYTLRYRIAEDIEDKIGLEVSKVAARATDEQGQSKYDLLKIYQSDAPLVANYLNEVIRRILAEYSDIATNGETPYIVFLSGTTSTGKLYRSADYDVTVSQTHYYSWGGTTLENGYFTTSETPAVSGNCYAYDSEEGTMTQRTGAISKVDKEKGVDFNIPDFDTTQKGRALEEIERFIVLCIVAKWFETRLPEMGKYFAETAEASAIRMLRLIRARKTPTR